MATQFLFCVETNNGAGTDWVYIKDTIDEFYIFDNKYSFKPIKMGGKAKYKSNSTKKEINNRIGGFCGKTIVIYCIDTDNFEKDIQQKKEFEDIKAYCNEFEFDFVWFCRDIEDVYLGESLSNNKKVDKAREFRRKKSITKIDEDKLNADIIGRHKSNIMNVLDKYLKRKSVL